MMCRALSTQAGVSKETWASISVEILPGMILRISLPNSTSKCSRAASACSSIVWPSFLPAETAALIRLTYSGFLEAARIRDGLVVASWGLYLPKASLVSSYRTV